MSDHQMISGHPHEKRTLLVLLSLATLTKVDEWSVLTFVPCGPVCVGFAPKINNQDKLRINIYKILKYIIYIEKRISE